MKTKDHLRILFKSRYPIIYLVTHEEKKALDILSEVADDFNMDLWQWSFASPNGGILSKYGIDYIKDLNENNPLFYGASFGNASVSPANVEYDQDKYFPCNPQQLLNHIAIAEKPAIFVLYGFRPLLDAPSIVRQLLDICMRRDYDRDSCYKPIILVSPVLSIPPDLEKRIIVVDMELPTYDEIAEQLDAVCDVIKQAGYNDRLPTIEDRDALIRACQGLTEIEIKSVLSRSWVEHGKLDISAIQEEKRQIIRKNGALEYYTQTDSITNVGGNDQLKSWLLERVHGFNDLRAREFGLETPRGLMLLGIPGTGKTLIAKSISSLWGIPLLRWDVGRVFAGLVGASENNARTALKVAEAVAPCILWIDEIEKMLSGTGSSNFSDGGTTARVYGTFLTWLQEKTAPVFVVATANDVTQLPDALLRKRRFDEIFWIDLPTSNERQEIFEIHLRKKRREPSLFDLPKLAEATQGFSGAEIEEVINAALYTCYREYKGEKDITTEHLISAAKATSPLSVVMKDNVKSAREWAINHKARFASSQAAAEWSTNASLNIFRVKG